MHATLTAVGPQRSRAADETITTEMWDLWVAGESQATIAGQFHLTQQTVSERLNRHRQRLPEEDRSLLFWREAEMLHGLYRPVFEVIHGPRPPLYSAGRPVRDAHGQLVDDHAPMLAAVDTALKIHDRIVRLYGLAAPTRTNATVAAVDAAAIQEATQAAADRARARLVAEGALAYLAGEGGTYR